MGLFLFVQACWLTCCLAVLAVVGCISQHERVQHLGAKTSDLHCCCQSMDVRNVLAELRAGKQYLRLELSIVAVLGHLLHLLSSVNISSMFYHISVQTDFLVWLLSFCVRDNLKTCDLAAGFKALSFTRVA